ncbi:MAG: hypothetical protein ACOVQ2_02885, partial [Flavobacterium sp.]
MTKKILLLAILTCFQTAMAQEIKLDSIKTTDVKGSTLEQRQNEIKEQEKAIKEQERAIKEKEKIEKESLEREKKAE